MPFKKGHKINLGKHWKVKDTTQMSLSHKGKHYSSATEFKKGHKIGLGNKNALGCVRSLLTRKRMSKPKSEKARINIGKAKIREKNPQWKGEEAKYVAKHSFIYRQKGRPEICKFCGTTLGKLEWANKDHKYSRNPDDYISLCVSCHNKYDQKK